MENKVTMKQKVLVLATWFDGGPDSECSAWKVLDENFNDITDSISEPDFGAHYDLYYKESSDKEDYVDIAIGYISRDALDHFCQMASALISDKQIEEYRKDLLPLVEAQEEFFKFYKDDEKRKSLWKKSHAIEEELSEKYRVNNHYSGILLPYIEHTIGVDEFVQMNNITKVIEL